MCRWLKPLKFVILTSSVSCSGLWTTTADRLLYCWQRTLCEWVSTQSTGPFPQTLTTPHWSVSGACNTELRVDFQSKETTTPADSSTTQLPLLTLKRMLTHKLQILELLRDVESQERARRSSTGCSVRGQLKKHKLWLGHWLSQIQCNKRLPSRNTYHSPHYMSGLGLPTATTTANFSSVAVKLNMLAILCWLMSISCGGHVEQSWLQKWLNIH